MSIDHLLFIGLPVMVMVWLFFSHRSACERAEIIAKNYCQQRDIQFLDDTAQFQTWRFMRNGLNLRLYRVFIFEYRSDITERGSGWLIMRHHQAKNIGLDEDASIQ